MAHQDYSQICPIFKEGVEQDLVLGPFKATASVDWYYIHHPIGREMKTVEAFGMPLTATCSGEVVVNVYKLTSASASTEIASISHSVTSSIGTIYFGTSGAISVTNFTSTDMIMLKLGAKGTDATPFNVIIRYKDK